MLAELWYWLSLLCICAICLAVTQLLQTGVQQEENQISVSARRDGGDDRLTAVLTQTAARQQARQHRHAALLTVHHGVSFYTCIHSYTHIYTGHYKLIQTENMGSCFVPFSSRSLNSFHCYFSFVCFHKCLLILTSPFFHLFLWPLCSPSFFNASPPAVASAFAIASPPPFGRQRKSKTVKWSTSTDLGNRHCVACSQGVCVQCGVLVWLCSAS